MGKYILKRLGYLVIVAVILSFILYMIYSLVPANRAYTDAQAEVKAMKNSIPAGQYEEIFNQTYLKYQRMYGTDTDNKVVRYLRWVGVYPLYDGSFDGLLQGNFGYSYDYKKPVVEIVKWPMINTIKINIFATVLALGITIPLGIHCAVRRGSKRDQAVQVFTIIGYSLPTFLIAIIFIWLFCGKLGWFPPSGMETPGNTYTGFRAFADQMYYMALPLIVSTFCSLGGMTRYVRASMIESLSMDCIKTARAKGLREKVVIYSHAFRNALIPIVSLVVGWFLGIFGGSIMIENIFAWNGMGRIMISTLRTADYDVVMLMQMFYIILSLLGALVIDIVYGLVDPRVRVNK